MVFLSDAGGSAPRIALPLGRPHTAHSALRGFGDRAAASGVFVVRAGPVHLLRAGRVVVAQVAVGVPVVARVTVIDLHEPDAGLSADPRSGTSRRPSPTSRTVPARTYRAPLAKPYR